MNRFLMVAIIAIGISACSTETESKIDTLESTEVIKEEIINDEHDVEVLSEDIEEAEKVEEELDQILDEL